MKLSERVKQAVQEQSQQKTLTRRPATRSEEAPAGDPLGGYKQRIQETLYEKLGPDAFSSERGEEGLRRAVTTELKRVIAAEGMPLSPEEIEKLVEDITENILGLGPLQRFLDDPDITEIMVNGLEAIFVEREGKLFETSARFIDESHLLRVIDRIVSLVGRRIDEASPMVDARLSDGSRVNAVIPPLSVDGPTLTIRKFSRDPYQIEDLIRFGTVTEEIADFLRVCVEGRLNLLISGGTGSGKTTLLNVLSGYIPNDQRIVTIEDAVELQLHQRHVVRLESRPPNIEGRGTVSIRDLVRNSLRMRPDRIVVGEVRGSEALDMLQAMNTGHEGSLSTLHANRPRDALSRLETMVLMAGVELPVKAIREYISSAISLIVHLSRIKDGSRKITQIAEITGMEGETIALQDLFRFEYARGAGDGKVQGAIRATGLRPLFSEHLEDLGYELLPSLFESG